MRKNKTTGGAEELQTDGKEEGDGKEKAAEETTGR